MAQFNPNPGFTAPPDQTGRSGGFGPSPSPNRAFETLFAGLGDTAVGAVNAVDTQVQENIYTEARGAIDEARGLFGVEDATDRSINDVTGIVPPELQQSSQRLRALNVGYQQGTIRPSHYEGLLHSIVRGLRARYPGYDRQIDNIVQEITGITPANALLNSIMQEAQAEGQGISEEQRNQREYIEAHGAEIELAFPGRDPYSIPFSELQAGVRRVQATTLRNNQLSQQITIDNGLYAQDERSKMTQAREIANNIGVMAGTSLSNSQITQNYNSLMNLVTSLQNGDTILDAETQEQILLQGNALLTQISNGVVQQLSQTGPNGEPAPWSTLSEDNQKELIAVAQRPVKELLDSITNENYGMALSAARRIKLMEDTRAAEILDKYQGIRNFQALREMLGETWAERGLRDQNLQSLGGLEREVLDAIQIGIVTGQAQPLPEVIEQLRQDVELTPASIKALLLSTTGLISDPNLDDTQRANVINWLFGRDSTGDRGIDLLEFGVPGDDQTSSRQRAILYSNLASPEVTAKVWELSQNDPVIWNNYKAWSYRQFRENSRGTSLLIARESSSIKTQGGEPIPLFEVTYNTQNNQIQAVPIPVIDVLSKQGAMPLQLNPAGVANTTWQTTAVESAQRTLLYSYRDLNLQLGVVASILEKDGQNTADAQLVQYLQGLGIPITNIIESTPTETPGGNGRQSSLTPDDIINRLQNNASEIRTGNGALPVQLAAYTQDDNVLDDDPLTDDPAQIELELFQRGAFRYQGDLKSPLPGIDINNLEQVPMSGGRPNSRSFGGPRSGGSHAGVDIPAQLGGTVVAIQNGVVVRSDNENAGGYGNTIDIEYPDGTIHRHAHLNTRDVNVGDTVTAGQQIGTAGHSGNASPDFVHVHYEVIERGAYYGANGRPNGRSTSGRIDPRVYFRNR